jgi:hypothetical protein
VTEYSETHGHLEGPYRYRPGRFSLRRKRWYRWHLPGGESYLDVTEDYTREDFTLTDEQWGSLDYLMRAKRREAWPSVIAELLRSKKFWAVLVGVYLIFWAGGNWSYGYTHNCLRSHKEEVYNPSTEDTETVTVCDFYGGNAKRWTLLDPIRVVIGWDF